MHEFEVAFNDGASIHWVRIRARNVEQATRRAWRKARRLGLSNAYLSAIRY